MLSEQPVSRKGSLTRLNQLGRPGTPTGTNYVSLSLNPKNGSHGNSAASAAFNKLPIVEDVSKFEENLAKLSRKITLFNDTGIQGFVKELISINDDLRMRTTDLEKHRKLGLETRDLEKQSHTYDQKFNEILKELISCRSELKKLPNAPTTPQANSTQTDDPRFAGKFKRGVVEGLIEEPPNMEEVLKYALKLSKFTKAPPTMANLQFQIHPNNYVWPAEDALRRGMLALLSLKPEDVIADELGTSTTDVQETVDSIAIDDTPSEKTVSKENPENGLFTGYGDIGRNDHADKDNDLDLNLYEYDDDLSD